MSQPPTARPVRESLLAAARDLADAAAGRHPAHDAVRGAALAIEFHLDTLARGLARGQIEARLRSRAEAIQADLNRALEKLWAVEAALRQGGVESARLAELATTVRALGETEIDLVLEEFRSLGALD
ncbi:MAG: hypothetical protein RMK15_02245 [Chloroflexota bacterium]|jgi:hypothetical protein|nr:hypothetical protein [Chloroflexota bacterium]